MKMSRLLCDNPGSITPAVARLSEADVVFVDCEGKDLGSQGGLLSTLGLGVYKSPDGRYDNPKGELVIYLVDVLAFQNASTVSSASSGVLKPIFDLLSSSTVLKVGFDLRMDASELLHGHGVHLTYILDLQVADVLSRNGEDETTALQRLIGWFLPVQEVLGRRDVYKHVVKINGLDGALLDQGFVIPRKKKVDHSIWLTRPLDEEHLSYAADDIRLIHSLYTAIWRNRKVNLQDAITRSERYIQQHASSRPYDKDSYHRHGLMPLDGHEEGDTAQRARLCAGCRRRLPSSQYPTLKMGVGIAYCFVCYAVNRHIKLKRKRNTKGVWKKRQINGLFASYEELLSCGIVKTDANSGDQACDS